MTQVQNINATQAVDIKALAATNLQVNLKQLKSVIAGNLQAGEKSYDSSDSDEKNIGYEELITALALLSGSGFSSPVQYIATQVTAEIENGDAQGKIDAGIDSLINLLK